MLETLIGLVLAHALADFVFRSSRSVQEKAKGKWRTLLAHGGTVGLATAVLIGASSGDAFVAVLVVTGTHLLIDWGKTRFATTLSTFLADQAAHLTVLIGVAFLFPGLWANGFLGGFPWLSGAMAIAAGLVLAVRAGGIAVGLLMEPWKQIGTEGLPSAGAMIGMLERFLIFLLALSGEFGAIGFLIAAKSVLRFGTAREARTFSEYVIVGTLASFAWALLISLATLGVLEALSPSPFPALFR